MWITTDGGATYTELGSYSGLSLTWTRSSIDLSAYAGSRSVRIVFQVTSDATMSGDGWHIDDVAVTDKRRPVRSDLTGDRKSDILWRHKTLGLLYLWPMDGNAPLSETYVSTVDPADDVVGTGDFNGDGKSDLLWRHVTNGEVWIWLMDGATPRSRVYVATVPDVGYQIVKAK